MSNKILNIFKKRIKIKVKKFYENNEKKLVDQIKKLEKLIEKELNNKQMIDIIDNSPIKYFDLSLKDCSFKYLYPLAKIAIDELIYSYELSQKSYINTSDQEWYFESILFDYISNSNIIFKYYIDQYFKIDTVFSPEKLPNDFNINENTLISFNYCNVKRYNGINYLGKEQKFILIQASIHKPEEKLKKYNEENFEKDLKQIQPFLKINQIEPKKYYLFFILDLMSYLKNPEGVKVIKKYNFQFIYFCKEDLVFNYLQQEDFTYEIIPPKNLTKVNKKQQRRQIKFKKENIFSTIPKDYIGPRYCIYYDYSLKSFIKKICEELLNVNKNFLKEKDNYFLKYFGTIDKLKLHINRFNDLANKNDIIFIYLFTGNIIVANGTYNYNYLYLNQKCQCYQCFILSAIIECDLKTNINGFACFKIKGN